MVDAAIDRCRECGHDPQCHQDGVRRGEGNGEAGGTEQEQAADEHMQEALIKATYLNSAYAGLQTDLLITGDHARVEAALEDLCVLADSWTAPGSTG